MSHASAQGAEIHHSRVGERERECVGEGLKERIRELKVLLASVKESEKKKKLEESERERGRTLKKAHVIPECRIKL